MATTTPSGQIEEKVDLSAEVEVKIPQAQALVNGGQLKEALALLAGLEKRCRVGNDNTSLVKVCETSLQFCKDAGDHESLLATLQSLSTRRSQKSAAVQALVNKALPWCIHESHVPLPVTSEEEKEKRDKLVVALRDISDGKIFLEAERARLTRALATIKVRKIGWLYRNLSLEQAHSSLSFFRCRRNLEMLLELLMSYKKFMSRRTGRFQSEKRSSSFWNRCV